MSVAMSSLDGDQNCNVGISVYLSGVASTLFFCACCFLCCFPTPDPMCAKRRPTRTKQDNNGQGNVIIQPVVVDQRANNGDYEEEYYEEDDDEDKSYEEQPRSPKKKASKASNSGDFVTDDDFDFETPMEGTSRIEYKERTLPNGTKVVDEITYHPDGRRTVKKNRY